MRILTLLARRQFVRTQLAKAVMWYLLLDISSSIGRRSIYGSRNCPDLSFVDFPRQLLFTWIPALGSYWGIVFQYSVFSSLAVTCGLFTPQDWPPITGKLRDVYSVRDLWGKFWHQMLRRVCNCISILFHNRDTNILIETQHPLQRADILFPDQTRDIALQIRPALSRLHRIRSSACSWSYERRRK